MPNDRIAELIERKFISGLEHPGDPQNGVPAKPLQLPIFNTTGMPKEMADLVLGTARTLAEAIVHLIETDGGSEIVDKLELERLRAVGAETAPETLAVHCKCDRNRTDPLMLLTYDGGPRVVIDAPALLTGLQYRKTGCPHR
jgi:hypothetical protein